MFKAAVVTVSDRSFRGERPDSGGPLVAKLLKDTGYEITETVIVPDEQPQIEAALRGLCDEVGVALVVTTGGTGFSPRDVTPEATLRVCDRQVPGIAEAMRVRTAEKAPRSMLSRGVAVTRGQTLIVNFPGSPKAVRECMDIVLPVLKHAAAVLKGTVSECAAPV